MVSPLLRRMLPGVPVLAMVALAAHAEVVFDGVAAGDASSTDTILWTRADNGGRTTNLTAQVATDRGFASIVATLGGATAADSDFTLKLRATGLAANTRYFYRFAVPDGVMSPVGRFTTAPAANQRAAVKFGFSGDADGRFRPYPSIANIASHQLDFFVFLGDVMYETASTGSPAVPVISGATTDATQLWDALKAYEVSGERAGRRSRLRADEPRRPAGAAADAGRHRQLHLARQSRAGQPVAAIGGRAPHRSAGCRRSGIRREYDRQLQ